VRAGTDPLPADNSFHFVLTPGQGVSLTIVDALDRSDASLFLAKALSIGTSPTFQVEVTSTSRFSPTNLDKRNVVILNDAPFPPGGASALKRFVERGGGLLIVAGDHSTWPSSEADLFPGKLGPAVDRMSGRSGSLGFRDYSHPVFEVFKAPRSGDFSAAHIFRYRTVDALPTDRVLARYDDGAVAASERKVGLGRVIVWTSTLDDTSTDIAVKPVFLPLVHQLVRYLAHYEAPTSWFTVGQVLDLAARTRSRAARVVVTPAGERTSQSGGEGADSLLELNEQGVYEIRAQGPTAGRPEAIAVNLDPAESELSPLDPNELMASVTGHATAADIEARPPQEMTREDAERRQSLWWYLLLTGVMLLAAETVIANRLSRKEKFL
jgi:hypothetical protein